MPQDKFYPCLEQTLNEVAGEYAKQLLWADIPKDEQEEEITSLEQMWMKKPSPQRRKLIGSRSHIYVKRIPDASNEGV